MATLKEISKLTGVAESTISRVLNRDSSLSISDAKRALVIETAEKLQYVTPRRRRKDSTTGPVRLRQPEELVSLVLVHFLTSEQELSRPFYLGLRKGIEARCEAYGVNFVRVLEDEFDPASLHRSRNSGVLSIGELPAATLDAVKRLDIPVVLTAPAKPSPFYDSVYVDVERAAEMMCEWLTSRGIKRPALLGSPDKKDGRYIGYKRYMESIGSFDPALVFDGKTANTERVDQLFERFDYGSSEFPDALIVEKDQLAVEVYQKLQQRGIKVPDDISVVGFNDSAVAGVLHPKLTTMRLDAGVIGESAVDMIMERLCGRQTTKTVQIQPAIMKRASTV